MLFKFGEAVVVNKDELIPLETIRSFSSFDGEDGIEARLYKFAMDLKVIAPQAKDFLYFTCVMMHAAEAALLNDDGTVKKLSNGRNAEARWEKVGKDAVRWVCNCEIKPFKNANNDIFAASELKIAYKKWVGKPLCLDHKSDSVDKIRGVIIDTYWDDKRKRIIALCALDKKNYPDLADKVSTGVAPCVSMGTAVGKAVCTEEGCHRVARTEKDFCVHMQTKSGYGEINMDLNPLELSLVVNGADPKAVVKHVIAKNMKEEELKDLSKAAELLAEYINVKNKYASVSTHEVEDIKKDLEILNAKVEKLVAELTESKSEDENDVVGPTRSKKIDELIPANSILQMMPPEATPTVNSSIPTSELQRYILGAKRAIASLQDSVVKTTITQEDSVMKNKLSYYQGTLEANRGGQTYAPDPMQMKVREEDKFLDAKPTGKIDEIFPGDKEIKEHMQRMGNAEDRKMFREATLQRAKEKIQRSAYFNGTEEPVEIGKTQYKPDPTQMKVREEDKFLEGPKPFPGVGDVEGLFGDDLKEKEKLLRANLNAKFKKGSSKAESAWIVYAGEQPVLKLSVNDLSKGQSELFYDGIATKVFGQNLLTQIKNRGLSATQQFLKSAQPAPAAPPPMPAPPPMAGPADGADGAPEAPAQVGEHAEPSQIVHDLDDLTDEMKAKLSDLEQGVAGPVGEDVKQLGGVEPASQENFAAAASTGQSSTKNLLGMRKASGMGLLAETKVLMEKIASEIKELDVAKEIYAKYRSLSSKQKDYLNQIVAESMVESKSLLKQANMVQKSASDYAFGVAAVAGKLALIKQGQEMDGASLFEKTSPEEDPEAHRMEEEEKLDNLLDTEWKKVIPEIEAIETEEHEERGEHPETSYEEENDEEDAKDGKNEKKVEHQVEKDRAELEKVKEELEKQLKETEEELKELEEVEADEAKEEKEIKEDEKGEDKDDLKVEIPPEALQNAKVTSGVQLGNLTTKADRTNARIKLAKEGLQSYEHFTDEAHPQGSVEMPGEHEKTQVDSKFHIPADIKEYMTDLADLPPKIKQAIERIDQFVREGKLKPEQVDQLTAHGVDPAAVKYWKGYWALAKSPEANDFAKKLVEQSANSKAAEDKKVHEAKLSRSYDLAYQMFAQGSINQNQISSQAAEIMKWNDEAFDSLKRTLLKNKSSEKANVVGNIGLLSSGDILLPGKVATASAGPAEVPFEQLFDAYFEGKKL